MKYLSYQDVLLVANYSELKTRDDADTSIQLCDRKFKLPVIPANMQDVINVPIAKFLSENGYFYIYHRFGQGGYDKDANTPHFVKMANMENWKLISISTGINLQSEEDLFYIKSMKYRVDFITIDVAHGDHGKVLERIKWIKENFPNVKVIAGNVMTPEAVGRLACAGADVVKIGIGQGSICTTRFQTGFSMPMFSCIQECAAIDTCIIADGGIQHIGDIAKAVVAGADMVMSGKLFASCIDSPAEIINFKKEYRGSTSLSAKKTNKHIEGTELTLEVDTTIEERLREITEALQSSISYAGGNDLSAFKKVRWIEGK